MTVPPFQFSPGISDIFASTQIAIIVIAIILMVVSTIAFRNTNLKRLKYVIAAFGLFAFNETINLIDSIFLDILPDEIRFTLVSSGTLGILLLLFLGIVKK